MQWSRKKVVRVETTIRRQRVWRVVGALLVLLVCAGIIYGIHQLTRLPALTLDTIEVVGGTTVSHAQVRTAAEGMLAGTYYRLIPKRFVYLYPKEAIEDAVVRIPRVREARLARTDRTTLTIAFTEYEPFALWCESADDPECLFIDRDGYAFAPAPRLEGGAFLRFVEAGRVPEVRERIFTSEYVRGATGFVEATYEALALHIDTIIRDETDVTYLIAGGGAFYTSLDLSFEDTLRNVSTVLESEEFGHLRESGFAYIDLRYGNKVFVREEPEVATTTASTTEAVDAE